MSTLPSMEQLETLLLLSQNDFSVTKTARQLQASQPGISRRLQSLEESLGVELFERRGRQLLSFSPAGEEVCSKAEQLMSQLADITNIARDHREETVGKLKLVTTQTQARYALPQVVSDFLQHYPRVSVEIDQATPDRMAKMVRESSVDLAIATESFEHFSDFLVMPCYRWRRCLIMPKNHRLADSKKLPSVQQMACEHLITYSFGLDSPEGVRTIFRRHGLNPDFRITATDAEAIKSHVRHGLGLGLVAGMAVDGERDRDLRAIDATELFPAQTTSIAIRRNSRLRAYAYSFIQTFAPHLTPEVVQQANSQEGERHLQQLFHRQAGEVK